MLDLEKAKKDFLEYVEKFDKEDAMIELKRSHSLRVMELSTEIAKSLKLPQEEVELATLIGLLHDIGRFKQVQLYQSFKDLTSMDHGNFGVEVLKKDNYIEQYCTNPEWQKIIYIAIKNHNKFKIEEGINEKELLFAKIIRDADKLDIIFEATFLFFKGKEEMIEKMSISKEAKEMLLSGSVLNFSKISNINDLEELMNYLAFVYDIYFQYTLEVIKEKKYMDKIVNRFQFENKETKETIKQIQEKVNSYLEERCK